MRDNRNIPRCRVAVIGGGAAGLAAAQSLLPRLQEKEHKNVEPLMIFEARNRIGGRIHTSLVEYDAQGTFPVEMGAAWVHGTGVAFGQPFGQNGEDEAELNPMVKILQKRKDLCKDTMDEDPLKAGLLYTCPVGNPDTRPRDVLHSTIPLLEIYVAGHRIDRYSADVSEALGLYEHILEGASRVGAAAYTCGEGLSTTAISIGKTIDCIRSQAPDRIGLGYRCGSGGGENSMVESLLGYYFHALQDWHPHDLSNIQLSEFIVNSDDEEDDKEEAFDLGGDDGDFPGPHCNVRGGMAALLQPLLENGVKERVFLDHEVDCIERKQSNDSDLILIRCRNGTEVLADYCIVTMSIGCLKVAIASHIFHPTISDDKQEAIAMLQMGCYRKVFLFFDNIFWPTEATIFGLVRFQVQSPELLGVPDDGLGNYLSVANSFAKDGIACLEVTLNGKAAQWACGRTDEDIRNEVLCFLDDSIVVEDGSSFFTRCVGCRVTRWEEDKFSMGAYSGFTLGTLERHTESLGEPEWDGHLMFAGDAVIGEYEGSVHGALLSGEEAAKKVAERIS